MAKLTCLNCRVIFRSPDLHRDHYKSDWHQFNLKRKIMELPPITAEEFQLHVAAFQEEKQTKAKGKTCTYCTVCKKSFSSDQSFKNHLQSKKHYHLSQIKNVSNDHDIAQPSFKSQELVLQKIGPVEEYSGEESIDTASSDTEEVDFDEWGDIISDNNPILSNDCLFCTHHSSSLTKNVKHMSVSHSFFIPHIEYLADLKGLLLYLGEKICQGYLCIWCNDKINCFTNMQAVRNHMIDKGHTKIQSDTEASLEYLDFYDFNMDFNEEDNIQVEDADGPVETDWKTTSNEDTDAVTMLLPSGEVICHRSLMRYFRQTRICEKQMLPRIKESKMQNLLKHYRRLGWSPMQKEQMKKKVKDIKYINYIQSKYETKLKVKANKLQKHFRAQVDF